MRNFLLPVIFFISILINFSAYPQAENSLPADSLDTSIDSIKSVLSDSLNTMLLDTYKQQFIEFEQQQRKDSLTKAQLEKQLQTLQTGDYLQREELQRILDDLQAKKEQRLELKKAQVESLKESAIGYPVLGPLNDTLFLIYNKIGSFTSAERAENITKRIDKLYDDDFLNLDSIQIIEEDGSAEIVYGDMIIMSITETDVLWSGDTETKYELAEKNEEIIKLSLERAIAERTFPRMIIRIGLTILVFLSAFLVIWLINKLYKRLVAYLSNRKERKLKDIKYKNYTVLSVKQETSIILYITRIIKWILIILAIYLIVPLVFSIFPITRQWADVLFGFIWMPLKKILLSVWDYLPNVFIILVIVIVFRYLIRLIKYFFSEIAKGRMKLPKFYPEWALPTFHIIRVLLIAFAFVMIFPYLPGANSPIFAGVSVFLGLLVSLGSSSAIANIIAGLVITYMRPFQLGDRIQFGDKTGDVIEKTILVTRLRTIKNEEITIPNSTILTGNTVNYSAYTKNEGLIIHVEIAMDYDYPWQDIYEALIKAALQTDNILKDPKPFVLQLSLNEFYVTYQINAYINDANKQAEIYSNLNQNIQDVFAKKGLNLLSPNYEVNFNDNTKLNPQANSQPENTVFMADNESKNKKDNKTKK